ncbi:LysR family transcriptional regulator [Cupriavidus agavae]|uniref:DNA-binding transcriptional LysR family regulator n=1 Tax=Cupriavidus agavae TaxID=1001822 RepID=A0A4Q7R8N5_9BURK|nr:LysR family transcriptional regulator [Cupriavidus agavae]RZT29265.1 DNA-binding transcriptional LysR family regulator [Cupriavidus agavae]
METPDRLLRSFLRIAETQSLSRAADRLGQTQSGVSKQLAALEAYLGKPLFVRTGRGVALTEAGSKLRDAIEAPYRAIDLAAQSIRDTHGTTQGTLRIAFVHTVNYYFLAEAVAGFIGNYPAINLSLMGRSSADVVALVESGKADLGVAYDTAVDTAALEMHPLFEDDMCLVTSRQPDPALAAAGIDLRGQILRLVGFPRGYALRRMVESAGLEHPYVAEAETVDAILKLVAMGVGDSILPSRLPDRLLNEYGLNRLKIEKPLLRRRIVAVKRSGRQALPLVDTLFGSLLQAAGALAP